MLRCLERHRRLLMVADVAAVSPDDRQEFHHVRGVRRIRVFIGPFDLTDQRRGTLPHYQGVRLLHVLGMCPLFLHLDVDDLLP